MIHLSARIVSALVSALAAVIVMFWPSPQLLANDCACPKPKVKITAIHSITAESGTPVKVFFGGKEVPPEAEPVAMERDKEYALTITLNPAGSNFNCSANVDLTFPHCTIEYSRDNGTTWIRGSRTFITAYDNQGVIAYDPPSILLRITAPPSDSAADTPAPGSAATPQTTPPAYSYGGSSQPAVPTPPGLGLEIPLGAALMPEGYRSAGLLVNYGPADASFAAPANLHFNAISGLESQVTEYDIVDGSNEVIEKHIAAPQAALRVSGWNPATQPPVSWTDATETLVEVFDPDQYDAEDHSFSGDPHSYYRLEVATGNGLADGVR
nr:hypothetical protein [Akkermansiaceae bacterium]